MHIDTDLLIIGDSSLHKAAWEGHLAAVKYLIEHGADKSVKNKDGTN